MNNNDEQRDHVHAARTTYRRLIGYTLQHRAALLLAAFGMLCYALVDSSLAYMMRPLLDEGLAQDASSATWIPIVFVLLFALRGLGAFLSTFFLAKVKGGVTEQLRNDLAAKLVRLPIATLDNRSASSISAHFSYFVERLTHASSTAITVVIRDTFTIIGLMLIMLLMNPLLALLTFVAGPFLGVIVARASRLFRHYSKQTQKAVSLLSDHVEEAVAGRREIKIYGADNSVEQNINNQASRIRRLLEKVGLTQGIGTAIVQLIAAVAVGVVVYFAMAEVQDGDMSPGRFVAFLTAALMLLAPLKRLTNVNAEIQQGISAADALFIELDLLSETNTGSKTPASSAVELNDVCFAYDQQQPAVLHNINLRIEPGQHIALVGPSGSGKSTLLNLLPRFYDVQSGTVSVGGVDIRELSLKALRDQFAMVSQHPVLFNLSIRDNIAYGIADANENNIRNAAEQAHALEFIEALPNNFNTIIGQGGVKLSGGQRQRIALARAILKDAPILLLDEATSALDGESEQLIKTALQQFCQNRTTITIAHRLSTIEHADQIIVMEHGRTTDQGTHSELIAHSERYRRLYQSTSAKADS